jgi:outer membrane murein-binding lipoprotein Lpp
MREVFLVAGMLLLAGCINLNIHEGKVLPKDIPREKPLSFETQTDISAVATANLEKSAQIYYEGTQAKSPEADFVYQCALRIAGILGINTQYDAKDPEQLKEILTRGTKALEEKNRQIDDLRRQVEDYQVKVTQAKDEAVKATSRAGLLARWIRYLVIGAALLLVIQIITGLPVFTGSLSLLKKAGKQTVAGIQEIRDDLKKRAEQGDAQARDMLTRIDTTLHKHQDEQVKGFIKKLKG